MSNQPPITAADHLQIGELLLKSGATLQAYDAFAEGLKHFPADVRLRQRIALALARTGASESANQILGALAREGHSDEETLGLLARTHKDLWAASLDTAERQRHLRLAFEHYRDAHRLSNGYWSGINAATMALLLGQRDDAASLAKGVREACLELATDPSRGGERYWILATLGEAALVRRDFAEAADWYAQAVATNDGRIGELVSTRRNARLILRYLQADAAAIEACFQVPRVVVFAGHLIDRPDRPQPRFPPSMERLVADAIRNRLRPLGAGYGYASAACGGDILFLEGLADIKADAHVVLPYSRDQFKEDCVDYVPGSDWAERYERVLAGAREVTAASPERMAGGGMSYEYGFLMLDGAAGVRADELDTELVCLAVWDGRPGDGPGGTASSVERWRKAGRRLELIDLGDLMRREGLNVSDAPARGLSPVVEIARVTSGFEPEIRGLLFADARGFSKLTEDEIPLFVKHFLGVVASELGRSSHAPILTNTWGDGLYFVFEDVQATGEFALALCAAVKETDWIAKGFRHELGLRIGLHAGPVYSCVDPVTGRQNYLGVHVSRAARIEPITPPGEVYASGAFAALARSEEVREFTCAYVGQTPQAKGYGTFPTFVVHRRQL